MIGLRSSVRTAILLLFLFAQMFACAGVGCETPRQSARDSSVGRTPVSQGAAECQQGCARLAKRRMGHSNKQRPADMRRTRVAVAADDLRNEFVREAA